MSIVDPAFRHRVDCVRCYGSVSDYRHTPFDKLYPAIQNPTTAERTRRTDSAGQRETCRSATITAETSTNRRRTLRGRIRTHLVASGVLKSFDDAAAAADRDGVQALRVDAVERAPTELVGIHSPDADAYRNARSPPVTTRSASDGAATSPIVPAPSTPMFRTLRRRSS